MNAKTVIDAAWVVWLIWWIVAATRLNRMQKREPAREWLFRLIVMLAAFWLLFRAGATFGGLNGIMNRRFVPYRPAVRAAGAALTCAGVAFSIWARQHIGRYWSGSVSIRADHQLIRTGPYSRIRHPIYTGLLLGVAGTVLADGHYGAVAAFLIIFAGLAWKALLEESLLKQQFGAAFEEHERHTGFFLPRLS